MYTTHCTGQVTRFPCLFFLWFAVLGTLEVTFERFLHAPVLLCTALPTVVQVKQRCKHAPSNPQCD